MLDDIGQYVVPNTWTKLSGIRAKGGVPLPPPASLDNQHCWVLMKRTGRVVGQNSAEKNLLASILAAISTRPTLVCVSGCFLEFVQMLDKSPLFPLAVQSFKRFDQVSLPKLMHEKSYSVAGIKYTSFLYYCISWCHSGGNLD